MKAGELYGVGGAVCVVPDTCSICGGGCPTYFEAHRSSMPTNNRIVGTCQRCLDHAAAVESWRESHPAEAAELRALAETEEAAELEAVAENPESAGIEFGTQQHRQIQSRVASNRQRATALKAATNYPAR